VGRAVAVGGLLLVSFGKKKFNGVFLMGCCRLVENFF
jgi:hypothetical protein